MPDPTGIYRRRTRERRIEADLCQRCGQRPPIPGRRGCETCMEVNRVAQRARYRPGQRIWHCEWCGGVGHQERSCALAKAGERRLAPELEERVGGLP